MALIIREPQIQVLRDAQREAFEQRLGAHCRRFFPRAANALGDGYRGAIVEAIQRARSHGFTGEREICKYANLMFTFGRSFDRSPLIGWAAAVLASSLPGPVKMERLYAAALAHEPEGRGYFAPIEEPR